MDAGLWCRHDASAPSDASTVEIGKSPEKTTVVWVPEYPAVVASSVLGGIVTVARRAALRSQLNTVVSCFRILHGSTAERNSA
jgi:hypothetical protein